MSTDERPHREYLSEPGRPFAARWTWGRIAGGLFGIATQLLFLCTVVYLFQFLRYGSSLSTRTWPFIDLFFAIGFAAPHSLLLVPMVQRQLKAAIPAGLLGCLHCCVTCISLLIMFHFWGRSEVVIWQFSGLAERAMLVGFYSAWVGLFYSLYLTGMGYQTGLTQWWYWIQSKPVPKREFVIKGAYRWLRHPIYMSFLGLIWFTPTMTLDHALLTFVWTIYIYAGSYFKDRRLLRYIGDEYREYARRVPGLPIIGFGPLLKMRS